MDTYRLELGKIDLRDGSDSPVVMMVSGEQGGPLWIDCVVPKGEVLPDSAPDA